LEGDSGAGAVGQGAAARDGAADGGGADAGAGDDVADGTQAGWQGVDPAGTDHCARAVVDDDDGVGKGAARSGTGGAGNLGDGQVGYGADG
jgi:hypothetical protein